MDWNCTTTLIGSLPHTDAAKALNTIREGGVRCSPWPQLPFRDPMESMYIQTASRLPGLKVDEEGRLFVDLSDYDPMEFYTALLSEDLEYFRPSEDGHQGLYGFLDMDHTGCDAVKGQVTGPISEGLQIQDSERRPVIYDESYAEIVRKAINMYARWQERELGKLNEEVIIFWDEPSLTLLGTPFASISSAQAVEWINESMEGISCHKAIHCCGNTDWPMVLSTNTDILSFDAYAYGHTLALYPDEVSAFLERGGVIAWGIVPNSEEGIDIETPETLMGLMDKHLDALSSKGIDRDLLLRRSILTPQCGLGGISESKVSLVLSLLRGLSDSMRERYGLK